MRNPGRTSATGTAIIIGVTLVVTIIVGAASVRTTLTNAVNDARPFDLMATSTSGALTDDQQAAIAATDGVARHRRPVRRPRHPDDHLGRARLRRT